MSQLKNKFVVSAAYFYTDSWQARQCARNYRHTKTHRAVSCHVREIKKKRRQCCCGWRQGVWELSDNKWQALLLALTFQLGLGTSTRTCWCLLSDTLHCSSQDPISSVKIMTRKESNRN